MHDPKTIADAYIRVWNEADPAERRAQLSRYWSAEARYVDPLMRAEGREAIAAMIEGARAQFPGHGFTLGSAPDGHDAYVRFSWGLAAEGQPVLIEGTDMVRLDGEGRITEVIGFLDKVPG